MSMVGLIVAVLLLSMQACNARHTFDFDIVSYSKDAVKTRLVHGMDSNNYPMLKDTKEASSGLTKAISIATLLDKKTRPTMQGLKGKTRIMLEYDSSRDESKDEPSDETEDVVVMDYVAPHRKSPIHNHH